MANAFDMFKKMQKLIVPDYSDYTELTANNQFTCPSDGFLFCQTAIHEEVLGEMYISVNGIVSIVIRSDHYGYNSILLPVSKDDKILYSIEKLNSKNSFIHFHAAREN